MFVLVNTTCNVFYCHHLGNNKLHELTSQKQYTLRIDLEDFRSQTRYAVYPTFRVGPESDCYRLAIGSYTGTAGNFVYNLYINTLTLGAVWQCLLPCADVYSPLSMLIRLLGPVASDLPVGDYIKFTHKFTHYVQSSLY